MSQRQSTAVAEGTTRGGPGRGGRGAPPVAMQTPPSGGRLFRQYKPEQGKATRIGTFVGVGALVAWGAWFIYDRLQVYAGDDIISLMITIGIPILFAVIVGAVAWWFVFVHRGSGDFMIATEGEMKKVSWSTRRELIGSTKVVVMFTVLLAVLLFVIDLFFQSVFKAIGVLKV